MGNTLQLSGKKKTDLSAAASAELRNDAEGFPGGPGVKNLPAFAGDGFEPWSGKIHMSQSNEAHAPQLLSPCTLEPMFPNKRKSPL